MQFPSMLKQNVITCLRKMLMYIKALSKTDANKCDYAVNEKTAKSSCNVYIL